VINGEKVLKRAEGSPYSPPEIERSDRSNRM
jgi:hypothetical protein